jgi:DNA polymerase-3 subunit delta
MPEIPYKDLNRYLKSLKDKRSYPVYLLYGEEMLYKTALDTLLDAIPQSSTQNRDLSCDTIDGTDENIHDVIERMNTYSLLSGLKVVTLPDSKIFYSKQDISKLLEKAREAYTKNDLKKAARSFINVLSILNRTYEEFRKPAVREALAAEGIGDAKWLEHLNTYCIEQGLPIVKTENVLDILDRAIGKGFPNGNSLVITTDFVDKRRSLFKSILNKGLIIDCSVPKGERREDKLAQETVLLDQTKKILAQREKTIDRDAFNAVKEMTGFDLRNFSQNMEKLVVYVGERNSITADDVDAVLSRTKKDPIYELTNAISERDIYRCLFFLNSLLSDDVHPLQVLAAITNQVRKLVMTKGFLESEHGRVWYPGLSYSQFKTSVMPALQSYDKSMLDQLDAWNTALVTKSDGEDKKKGKRQRKVNTDLLIAKNPKNPYPVFLLLKRSQVYSTEELLRALQCLSRADIRLKSTGQSPKLILENTIFCMCSKEEPRETRKQSDLVSFRK